MDRLKSIEAGLVRAEQALLVALIGVMVALAFAQVALRGLFSVGILWADTLLRHLVLWTGFLGAALAAAADRQFAMDASSRLFSGRAQVSIRLICRLFTAGVSVFLTLASVAFFREEFAHCAILFSVGAVNVPTWIFELILPAGFGLLAFHYFIKTALIISQRERVDTTPSPSGGTRQGGKNQP